MNSYPKSSFINRIKTIKSENYLFRFLNPEEIKLVYSYFSKEYNILCYGGYDDAEYKRVLISKDENIDISDLNVVMLRINYNKKFLTISHRKVLGNILSLGITRDNIGDIVDNQVMVCKEILPFILQEFKMLDHSSIELEVIDEVILPIEKEEIKRIYTSSLRLDIIISKSYNLSREKSKELITSELVKLNYKLETNSSQICNNCDIISVRKFGRIYIKEILGLSKKENYIIDIIIKH